MNVIFNLFKEKKKNLFLLQFRHLFTRYSQSSIFVDLLYYSALFATSVVLILNFSAYLTSDAKVLSNLRLLACSGIAAALLADFFMIPILLKKGKVFGEEKGSEFIIHTGKTEELELQLNNS